MTDEIDVDAVKVKEQILSIFDGSWEQSLVVK